QAVDLEQLLNESRNVTGEGHLCGGPKCLPPALWELENLLDNHGAVHFVELYDLANRSQAARAAGQPPDLDYYLHRRGDNLPDGAARQVDALGFQGQGPQAWQSPLGTA